MVSYVFGIQMLNQIIWCLSKRPNPLDVRISNCVVDSKYLNFLLYLLFTSHGAIAYLLILESWYFNR